MKLKRLISATLFLCLFPLTASAQQLVAQGYDWLLVNSSSSGRTIVGTTAARDIRLLVAQSTTAPKGWEIDGSTGDFSPVAGTERIASTTLLDPIVDDQLLINATALDSDVSAKTGADLNLLVQGNSNGAQEMAFVDIGADSGGSSIYLMKTRSTTADANTAVQASDTLGSITAYGADGTDYELAGQLRFFVDGTPGNNDMPGGLSIRLTADGAATLSDVWKFENDGDLIGQTTGDIGWTPVSGANTACNTTCTSGCVFGANTASGFAMVGCADATADICLCAGPS